MDATGKSLSFENESSRKPEDKAVSEGKPCGNRTSWAFRVRVLFLGFSVVCGAILAYTARHFVNGDAIAYFDMADAFGRGLWSELANLSYSPGYAVLLGIVIKVFGVAPVNELFAAKALNLFCYICVLLAMEVLLRQIQTDEEFSSSDCLQRIPWVAFRSIAYGLFLVASLIFIRIQVVSPDMLVFCFMLLATSVLVSIKKTAKSYFKFALLGFVLGIGYLCKTLFFPMTPVFLVLSALYCTSIRKAVPRVLVAVLVFLVSSAPLVLPVSMRLGRFSFGEAGNYNYAVFVSGKGSPIHLPERIWDHPDTVIYRGESRIASYPAGFDTSYWNEGVKASFDLRAQISALLRNTRALVEFSGWLYLTLLVWLCAQVRIASSFRVKLFPPSLSILLATIAVAGTGLFCLVYFEPRYVAPFVFLGSLAALLWPQYRIDDRGRSVQRSVQIGTSVITALMIVMVIFSVWDQSERNLCDEGTKQSHRKTFLEYSALKDFFSQHGIHHTDNLVAVAGMPSKGIYWARLTGVKAAASIADQKEFLAISPQVRQGILKELKRRGFAAVVATDKSFNGLQQEGWNHVPGTSNYFVRFLGDGF